MSFAEWMHTDWSQIDFEDKKKAEGLKASTTVETPKGACPKCGKHIGKGLYVHVKACDGHRLQA